MGKKRNEKLNARERPDRIHGLNASQEYLLQCIDEGTLIFASGSAGVGKTWISVLRACELLYEGHIDKVVLTRPNVETAKSLGALPGTLEEKLDPYMAPMLGMIAQQYTEGWLNTQVKNDNIEIQALGFVQGMTYDNAIVIVDEAEHLSPRECYIILTRIGQHSKMILCGDSFQRFTNGQNGFEDAMNRLEGVDGVFVCEFTSRDIVRSDIVRDIVRAYERR